MSCLLIYSENGRLNNRKVSEQSHKQECKNNQHEKHVCQVNKNVSWNWMEFICHIIIQNKLKIICYVPRTFNKILVDNKIDIIACNSNIQS